MRLELADRALQLLLLLTQHLPPALFSPETYHQSIPRGAALVWRRAPFDAPTPADVDESAAEGGAIVAQRTGSPARVARAVQRAARRDRRSAP